MAASLEETLISVWRQVMVEDAKVVTLHDQEFPVRGPVDPDCVKLIFVSETTNCEDSNNILDGHDAGWTLGCGSIRRKKNIDVTTRVCRQRRLPLISSFVSEAALSGKSRICQSSIRVQSKNKNKADYELLQSPGAVCFKDHKFSLGRLTFEVASIAVGVCFRAQCSRVLPTLPAWRRLLRELDEFVFALVRAPVSEHAFGDTVRPHGFLPELLRRGTRKDAAEPVHSSNRVAGFNYARRGYEVHLMARLAHDTHMDRHSSCWTAGGCLGFSPRGLRWG